MIYRSCIVESCAQAQSVRGDAYLRLRLRAGRDVIWATCFDDGLFAALNEAGDTGALIMLELRNSDKKGPNGLPFENVTGIEDPRQEGLPGVGL